MEQRTKRFYNNINSKNVKGVEEIASAIALIRNILLRGRVVEGVIPS